MKSLRKFKILLFIIFIYISLKIKSHSVQEVMSNENAKYKWIQEY